jgi:hypothetical protein
MDMETKRVTVEGVRGADAPTLQVLTQDVLGLPINQISPATVCDLFALAEVADQVPSELARDLAAFCERCSRELSDIPDAASLSAYTAGLKEVEGGMIPETLRLLLSGLADASGDDDIKGVLTDLAGHYAEKQASPFEVSTAPSAASVAAEKRPAAKKAPAKKKTKAADKDPRRVEWIQEFVVARLANYETGLKESLLVGAAKHKAPYDDMTDREVRAVLRAMGRNGKLHTTVGRWLLNR